MKSHELADALELTAKLLREFPDGEPNDVLRALLQSVRSGKKAGAGKRQRTRGDEPAISQDMLEKLAHMSASEVERYLSHSEEFADTSQLRELAIRLKIPLSRKPNRPALINMIARSIETRHMDQIIRRRSSVETETSSVESPVEEIASPRDLFGR